MKDALPAGAYLDQHRFSRTTRFVVRPQMRTHILIAEFQSGQTVVCVEDLRDGKWAIRNNSKGSVFTRYSLAEAFAAEVHREESRVARLQASVPDKKE